MRRLHLALVEIYRAPNFKDADKALVENLRDRFTHLHILVNAAGVQRPSSLIKLDEYDWRRIVEVNMTGTFLCTQLAAIFY